MIYIIYLFCGCMGLFFISGALMSMYGVIDMVPRFMAIYSKMLNLKIDLGFGHIAF
ncbi:Uncharacterised protein [Campylobacter hyointestinalis subsp. hyointestinalis]|uniref:Uncharacterized protein n=1 Tax=Campylobacter hyointestinalis subsp. hyointestinalis TaxID=91352 RepID=A0A0S4SZ39_CAMHY|nr:hypothetical protein [Campylobacter hyointestinalis]CUU90989.1 Uncharacterised protein [Campylobacter hyointestinalis subsp. hyointestinalis]